MSDKLNALMMSPWWLPMSPAPWRLAGTGWAQGAGCVCVCVCGYVQSGILQALHACMTAHVAN